MEEKEKTVKDENLVQNSKQANDTQDSQERKPDQATENTNNSDDRIVLKKKDDYRTDVNDPDLLVTYNPKEGEPPTRKCPNCGEEMPTTIDTCVCCGHYLKEGEKKAYKPIAEDKAKKIRWIIGVICIVAFIIWYVAKNS